VLVRSRVQVWAVLTGFFSVTELKFSFLLNPLIMLPLDAMWATEFLVLLRCTPDVLIRIFVVLAPLDSGVLLWLAPPNLPCLEHQNSRPFVHTPFRWGGLPRTASQHWYRIPAQELSEIKIHVIRVSDTGCSENSVPVSWKAYCGSRDKTPSPPVSSFTLRLPLSPR
jgi:hypothetical protein